MTKKRVAIIGAGNIVTSHIKAIESNADRIELVGISDINQQRLDEVCATFNIPNGYTDSSKLLTETKPDLVHIITPPATHKDLIVECLEAGAWVFCEKPLCGSLAQFDEITAAEDRTGNYVSTVFQWRFGSAGKHLKNLIRDNAFGRPLVAVCNTLWYRTQAYYDVPWRGKFETEFGGPTVTLGIHLTDFMLWLLGDWAEVRGTVGILNHDIKVEDISMAHILFKNGAMASVINSTLSPRQESYLRLDFEKVTMELTALYRYTNEHWKFSTHPDLADNAIEAQWNALSHDFMGSHDQQLSEILDAMENGTAPPVQGAEARRILEFIASLYKSAFTGERVQQGSITPDDPFYHSTNGSMAIADVLR